MKQSRISTSQIAQICGVSQGTVDRALHDRKGISPATREKILRVAKEYGYRPNTHARIMAGGKSMTIGVVVFDLNNQYFSDLLTAIEDFCACRGYSTLVMFSHKDGNREIACIQNLYHMDVDGIVLCPVNQGDAYEAWLQSLGIPVVTVGNRLGSFPYAGIDNSLAMKEVAEYVLQHGYDHLIYVAPTLQENNTYAQTQRQQSFCAHCESKGISYCVTKPENAEAMLDPYRRNAIICPTDLYALKLLPLAKKHCAGIIGFDNIRLLEELELCLDSVAYDVALTAKMTVEYILDSIPISYTVPHTLIKRGSIV